MAITNTFNKPLIPEFSQKIKNIISANRPSDTIQATLSKPNPRGFSGVMGANIYSQGVPVGTANVQRKDTVSEMTTRPQQPSVTPTKTQQKTQQKTQAKPQKTAQQQYEEDIRKQIEQGYKEQVGFLTQQEKSLQQNLPTYLQQVATPFEQQVPLLEQQLREQEQRATQEQLNLAQQEQQALAESRRAGEEQSVRLQQLYGGVGGSSTAQAGGEILAREQLRQMGNIQTQRAQGMQNIQNQLRTITAEYNQNLATLRLQKEQALNTARLDFQKQLDAIKSERATAGVTKAQRTLDALQQFASRRQSIEDQNRSFEMNLQMMREQANINAQQAMLQTQLSPQEITPISFTGLFTGAGGQPLAQSEEARKLLQGIIAQGRTRELGLVDLGSDPVTGERLFQDATGQIIDDRGNLRSGVGQTLGQMQQPR